MAETVTEKKSAGLAGPLGLWARLPWWVKVLLIFAASRVVTTIILLVFAAMQRANLPWTAAHPDYFSFAGIWDGAWYRQVAGYGYPSVLPHSHGHITENAWAFLPAYPTVVAMLTALTGQSVTTGIAFNVVGVFVSVACAAGAALMFYRILAPRLGQSTALFSVVLLCVAPLSPILQVDYAESMQLFFLMCALFFVEERRYGMVLLFVAFMSFTRPSGLAFALFLGLHVIARWVLRARDPFPKRERVAAVIATAASAALGYAWPLIAGLATGIPNAYTDTELAWRQPYVGWSPLIPFTPWVQGANWWLRNSSAGGWLLALAILLLVAFVVAMFSPWVRNLGVDLRLWVVSWVVYLLAVFFPQSSVFRLLVPAFPLLGALAQPRSRAYRISIVALCILGQVGWVYIAYWVDGYDWTPP